MQVFRTLATGFFGLLLLVGTVAQAEDAVAPPATIEPWQSVITSQIEAFRIKDAPGAFQYAGAGFQKMFPTAEAFFVAIITSGYSPIMESRSHTFGEFRMTGDKAVVQEVRLVGNDQSLYEAFYQLAEEPNGWRVEGVQLLKQPGMGV
ncbi:MAG: Type topoisomerase gyrase/topo topoisomerase subunit [Devosia sp.]|uniref:DUF4864 domain-containing protein n=1 Tax=Devosia sp. TaxID=1871048 RepID=UPI0026042075|nr:DUF4864 domain-containing protein [Devosia sp.]MDB5542275.1 Type topoisomerase gyrase/topo topoisomerase subunit [Devosia sp.]